MIQRGLLACLLLLTSVGCGTTRWSDTTRTATEQMLISDAVDRAVSDIDFSALESRNVFLDSRFIFGTVDDRYIISTLRQHMLASGCVIKDKPEDADYIVEVRTGAVGTNRNDILFGTPSTQLPAVGGAAPVSGAMIPEIALFKRTSQQGVCKVAVFAYDRISGRPVWQSGTRKTDSKSRDVWVLGAGPFQSGSIHDGTKLSGERFRVPLASDDDGKVQKVKEKSDKIWVAQEIVFDDPQTTQMAKKPKSKPVPDAERASYRTPVTPSLAPAPPAALPLPSTPQMIPPAPDLNASQAGSVLTSESQPNPTAATIGAIQAFDWAKAVRSEPK